MAQNLPVPLRQVRTAQQDCDPADAMGRLWQIALASLIDATDPVLDVDAIDVEWESVDVAWTLDAVTSSYGITPLHSYSQMADFDDSTEPPPMLNYYT